MVIDRSAKALKSIHLINLNSISVKLFKTKALFVSGLSILFIISFPAAARQGSKDCARMIGDEGYASYYSKDLMEIYKAPPHFRPNGKTFNTRRLTYEYGTCFY